MPDQHHPITPPLSLMQQWREQAPYILDGFGLIRPVEEWLIDHAASWGYEQRGEVNEAELQKARDEELAECAKWLAEAGYPGPAIFFATKRSARRPKPPSLKEQALKAAHIELDPQGRNGSLIIRALEALPDD